MYCYKFVHVYIMVQRKSGRPLENDPNSRESSPASFSGDGYSKVCRYNEIMCKENFGYDFQGKRRFSANGSLNSSDNSSASFFEEKVCSNCLFITHFTTMI